MMNYFSFDSSSSSSSSSLRSFASSWPWMNASSSGEISSSSTLDSSLSVSSSSSEKFSSNSSIPITFFQIRFDGGRMDYIKIVMPDLLFRKKKEWINDQ